MRKLRVCFVITEDWYFWSHRAMLAKYLIQQGCEVDLVAAPSEYQRAITRAGISCHSVGMQRSGSNPLTEAGTVYRLTGLLRRLRPDVVHLVGMKPIFCGSLAAIRAEVPAIVCAVAGFGWLFTPGGVLKTSVKQGVQAYFRRVLAKRKNVHFIVQNTDHRSLMIRARMAREPQITLTPGAGVDTDRFAMRAEPSGPCTVVTHARMLWDKGIGDLVAAARLVRRSDPTVRFSLVGDPDPANPSSIPFSQLHQWNAEGVVRWEPRRDDIPQVLAGAHVACLPSYHEGFPLSLVEAAACGKAIVTNDVPGCNSMVRHNENGLLVQRGDVDGLADALLQLTGDPRRRRTMGLRGRHRVVQEMSCHAINEQTRECYESLLPHAAGQRFETSTTRRSA